MSSEPELDAPQRVLVVSQRPVDYGGGGSVRWRYLREALPALGWSVATVTARPNPTANEASTNPTEARLAAARARVTGTIGAVLRPAARRAGIQPEALAPNAVWTWTGRGAIRRAIEEFRPHVVWATSPPPSALFAAAAVLRRMDTPPPLVAELRDLWAGNPYFDAGGNVLTRIEAPSLRRAAAVVTVTDGCRERLLAMHPELAPRTHLLPNGFDPRLLERRSPPPPAERLTVLHAGSLYADRTAVALLRAAARPELADRIRIQLVGSIDAATESEVAAARGRGQEVLVEGAVTWEQSVEHQVAAHVAVVINSAATGGEMALPSKLFEALALGRPILALTPTGSDTEALLSELGQQAGCAPPDDERAVAAALGRLLDYPPPPVDPARLEPWSRAAVAERVAVLLRQLAGEPS